MESKHRLPWKSPGSFVRNITAVLVNGIERRLEQIIAQLVEEMDSILLEIEVLGNHVHLLIEVDPP